MRKRVLVIASGTLVMLLGAILSRAVADEKEGNKKEEGKKREEGKERPFPIYNPYPPGILPAKFGFRDSQSPAGGRWHRR